MLNVVKVKVSFSLKVKRSSGDSWKHKCRLIFMCRIVGRCHHVFGWSVTSPRIRFIDSPLLSSPFAPPPKFLSEVVRMEICRYIFNSFTVFMLSLSDWKRVALMWVVYPQFQAVNILWSHQNLHKPTWFRTSVCF